MDECWLISIIKHVKNIGFSTINTVDETQKNEGQWL